MPFFNNTIDNKPVIKDPDGNELIDLAASSFDNSMTELSNYKYARVTSDFVMRPDLVAFAEYRDQDGCEFILKWTGISNPFTLQNDDIIRIPDFDNAKRIMETSSKNENSAELVRKHIQNYFKFVNQDYDGDKSGYKKITDLKIPSAVINPSEYQNYSVPYINTGEEGSVTIKNGKVYFGDGGIFDAGSVIEGTTTVSDLDKRIQNILDNTMSTLSSQCLFNGMSETDFNRAKNNAKRRN